MTTISQAARDAAVQIDRESGAHTPNSNILRNQNIIQSLIDSETASLRQQLEEAKRERDQANEALHDKAMAMCGSLAFVSLYKETVAKRDAALARLAEANQALQDAASECNDLMRQRDTALARVAELEAQCAAMRESGNNPTHEMISAALCSRAKDDEGEFPILLDLLDFSGENKSRAVATAAIKAAFDALSSTAGTELLARVKELEKDKAILQWIETHYEHLWVNAVQSDGEFGPIAFYKDRIKSGLRSTVESVMAKDQEQDAGGER